VDAETLAKNLSGGYIERHTFDLGAKAFTMNVSVLENAVLSMYAVTFVSVSHFAFVDNQVGEWERLELTQMWIVASPAASGSEEWEVTLSLWDLAQVELRCAAISVDGESVR